MQVTCSSLPSGVKWAMLAVTEPITKSLITNGLASSVELAGKLGVVLETLQEKTKQTNKQTKKNKIHINRISVANCIVLMVGEAWQSPHVRESGIQQIFAVGIRNPEGWNPESTMVWNLESTMVWIPESGIQALHGFSYMGRLAGQPVE